MVGIESPTVPTELFDAMPDLVYDDSATLKSCALVSRSTLQTAQRHLFSTIQLGPPDLFHLHPNSCERFHDAIRESPHLATYVRHLAIIEGYHGIDTDLVRGGKYVAIRSSCQHMWATVDETLPKVLSQLVNIESFAIQGPSSGLVWGSLSTETQDALFATIGRPRLPKIELVSTVGSLPLLRAAVGLKSLSLFSNCISQKDRYIADTQDECKLDSLDILVRWDSIRWIMGPDSCLDLSMLRSLILRNPGNIAAESEFITRLSTSSATLEHLQIHHEWTVSFHFFTDFAQFPHLRSFYVDFSQHDHESTHPRNYPSWLIRLLLTIPDSNCIETIAIHLSRFSPEDLFSAEDYTRLDGVLVRPALRSLKLVRAKVAGAEVDARVYHDRLPLTNARRILRIEPDAKWVTERDLGCSWDCRWLA